MYLSILVSILSAPSALTITGTPFANIAPLVNFVAGAGTYSYPATITLGISACDFDGIISKVDFYNRNSLISSAVVVPYTGIL